MEINIDKINVGDKFSTETKLLDILGYPKASGNTRLSLIKDVQRYIDYAKTGKVARGKETNEIIITDKYIDTKDAKDGRTSEIIKYIKPLILNMENKSIGNKRLFLQEFKIVNEATWKKFKGNNKVEFYKYYLLNDFKGKLKTSLNKLYKENEWFYFSYDYLLISMDEERWTYELADKYKTEYINTMKSNIKDRIVARHKLEHPNEKAKTWKNLAYRYTSTLYKLVNDECNDAFNVDKCVDVVTIENSNSEQTITDIEDCTKALQQYYQIKMNDWIKKNGQLEEDVIKFHNEIWSDVNLYI